MLDKFLALLERFVIAHELIAANSAPTDVNVTVKGTGVTDNGTEPAADVKKRTSKTKPEQEDDEEVEQTKKKSTSKSKAKPADDEDDGEEEEQPKKKRSAKKDDDAVDLRAEIKQMANAFLETDDDDAEDDFDDLLDYWELTSVSKIDDEDVEEFHAELKKLTKKHFNVK